MAAGQTALSLAMSSSSPPFDNNSPSNLSSPLSDVEDKATDADEMDLDLNTNALGEHTHEKTRQDGGGKEDFGAESDSDGESKLSDVDVNDSEAETERLYNTPPKNNGGREIVSRAGGSGTKQFSDRRDRPFEPSPSKLQHQIRPDVDADADKAASENDSLSDADEEDEDAASAASSEPPDDRPKRPTSLSPAALKKSRDPSAGEGTPATRDTTLDSAESRKRKRSSLAAASELEQPARKRPGSIAAPEREHSTDDVAIVTDEGNSTNTQSGDHSGDEDNTEQAEGAAKENEEPAQSVEQDVTETSRSKRSKQRNSKKRKSKSPEEAEKSIEEAPEEPPDADGPAAEAAAEDEHAEADADEEAEAAHRNEEELERKRAAWDELAAIEKQFSNFRERLYQERLQQLEQEEAMLTGDNPNHPDYLAMLQCIDDRREDKIRMSNIQFLFRSEVLKKRAVAERAQILSQFHQSVRETREKVLEELGEEWYAIQHERRRHASTIPDFGIRLPPIKTQSIRNAVAYNKEVSILSGFAKHVGFPAAPSIHGASEDQVENDFEAITRARQSVAQPASHQPPVFRRESVSTALPFGQNLGPAGEQFIEQTPWANPNHPSHQIQRQLLQQNDSPLAAGSAGPNPGNRRHSHQQGTGPSQSPNTMLNGDSAVPMHKSHSAAGHEGIKASKMTASPALKQQPVAQAS